MRSQPLPDVADFSPDLLVELAQDGRLVYASQAIEPMLGRTPDSVLGHSFLEFIVPEDRERMLATFQKIVETGAEPPVQYGVLRGDGLSVLVDSRIRLHSSSDETSRIFVSLRDISDESSARALDQHRLDFYRVLVETDRAAAVFNGSGEVLFTNRIFQSMLGRIRNVEDLKQRVNPEARVRIETQWRLAERSESVAGAADQMDMEVTSASGETLWLAANWSRHRSESGERLYSVHYADVTRRKEIEQALGEIARFDVRGAAPRRERALAALCRALGFDRLYYAENDPSSHTHARVICHTHRPSLAPASERTADAAPNGMSASASPDASETSETSETSDASIATGQQFELEGLPDAAAARGETVIHPMGLQRIMPRAIDRLGATYDAYAGIPIRLRDGTHLGFVAGYRIQPIDDLDLTRTLLTLFAERIATGEGYLRNEAVLRAAQSRLDVIVHHSPDLVVESNDEFTIQYVSDASRSLLGFEPEHFVGKNILDLIHADDLGEARRAGEDFSSGRNDAFFVSRIQHADGTWRTLESRSVPYETSEGLRRSIILARDITDRLQTERTLKDTELRLDDASRMEAVGRLAGGIAHDFNNLLTAIIGYSDLVLDHVGPNSMAYGDAQEVLRAAERAGMLTRQLLTFSRRQPAQSMTVDLNAVLAETDRMVRRLIPENTEVKTFQSGELFPVVADQGQLEQVLVNLVINACDAMPRGGRLSIETRTFETDAVFETRSGALEPGTYTVLVVRDNGSGMDEETLSRAFEAFFTTKAGEQSVLGTGSRSGTGLGLATVRNIVQQSGGQIEIESKVGHGTAFSVYLPAASRPEEATAESDSETPSEDWSEAPGGTETVLLVEDVASIRNLLERALTNRGYTVLVAESATDALRLCARHEGPIELLLTDVVLPRASGVEIARQALTLRPGIRVQFMSGFPDETLEQHGVSRATTTILDKPFTPAAALHTIREVLDRRDAPLAMG